MDLHLRKTALRVCLTLQENRAELNVVMDTACSSVAYHSNMISPSTVCYPFDLSVCLYLCVYLYASSELISQCSSSISQDAVHQVSIRGPLPARLIQRGKQLHRESQQIYYSIKQHLYTSFTTSDMQINSSRVCQTANIILVQNDMTYSVLSDIFVM